METMTMPDKGWDDEALCKGQLDAFYSNSKGETFKRCRDLCAICPLGMNGNGECLKVALSVPSSSINGIWAGFNASELQNMKRAEEGNAQRCRGWKHLLTPNNQLPDGSCRTCANRRQAEYRRRSGHS